MSNKQKLNTRSSTEAELVGVNDTMALVLWTRMFLIEQGFTVVDNLIHQDNQSTILLARNGTTSSSKKCNISRFDIILLPTMWPAEWLTFDIVRLKKWSLISTPNPYRGPSFMRSAIRSSILSLFPMACRSVLGHEI